MSKHNYIIIFAFMCMTITCIRCSSSEEIIGYYIDNKSEILNTSTNLASITYYIKSYTDRDTIKFSNLVTYGLENGNITIFNSGLWFGCYLKKDTLYHIGLRKASRKEIFYYLNSKPEYGRYNFFVELKGRIYKIMFINPPSGSIGCR